MVEYIEDIAVFIILEGIVLRMVTNEEYKKYIKMCSGMILIILIIGPLNKATGFLDEIPEVVSRLVDEGDTSYIDDEFKEKVDDIQLDSFENTYEEMIYKELKTGSEKFENVTKAEVEIDENEEDCIGKITIYVENTDDKTVNEEEHIKKRLIDKYNFEKNKIEIVSGE